MAEIQMEYFTTEFDMKVIITTLMSYRNQNNHVYQADRTIKPVKYDRILTAP